MLATLEELDEHALIQILTEPKNALIKQYQRLFHMEGVELEVRTRRSAPSRSGRSRARPARAACARSSSRSCSTPCTSCPRSRTSSKVVVDESMVSADGKPLLIYSDSHKVAGGSSAEFPIAFRSRTFRHGFRIAA